jgi:glycosyltransferase involved in cell wall biosynthesis
VSVAIATRNGAEHLREQLTSILDQTVPPAEIVISDDASTDGTAELAERVAAAHPRVTEGLVAVRVLRNPAPLGIAGNFEAAIRATTGTFIALGDQDDRWLPSRLERGLAAFAERPALLLVHGDARLIDGDGQPLPGTLFRALEISRRERAQVHAGRAFRALLRRNLVTGNTVLARREAVEQALPIPPGWIHDEWIGMAAAAVGLVDLIEEPLVEYRQHAANAIGARRPDAQVRVSRLREARGERNARLLRRAESLVERLPGLSPTPSAGVIALAEAKLRHERFRSGLPASRLRRLLPIAGEALRGRYLRFGRPLANPLRDLVQPS